MRKYLNKVKNIIQYFDTFEISPVFHSSNKRADALNKLTLSFEAHLRRCIPMEKVPKPSIDEKLITTIVEEAKPN